jgi:hypothetical protein
MKVFTSGTVVQVFLLAGNLPAETWSDHKPAANRDEGKTGLMRGD